jgi:hypothetical protein
MSYRQKSAALATVCDIQTGYTARSRLEPDESGIPAIQLRDLRGEEEEYDPASAPRFALDDNAERYRAGSGDVLFRSRGEQNTAVAVTPQSNSWAVAILPLLILRPRQEHLDPGFLAWLINQPTSQRYFDSCARGTRLRMIPRPCLEKLEVPLPDLKTQRLVVEIARLAQRESALTMDLAEKKKALTSFALLEQARKAQPQRAGQKVARRTQNPAGSSERTNS